jgi:hypothetical protein
MTTGSRVNPNFPIPGIDQSSRGFRDNFAIIKQEIEQLQGKSVQLTGALVSDPVEIGNGTGDVVIPVNVNLANVQAAGGNLSVQYNFNNRITGSEMYYNAGKVGIGTNKPEHELVVIGNVRIQSASPVTVFELGDHVRINAAAAWTTVAVNNSNIIAINNTTGNVGIGTSTPVARLDVQATDGHVARFSSTANNSDNGVRFTTTRINSTMGLVLEQRSANQVGGMRFDQNGNLSLHVGENMDANLSDASRVINILPNNNVGIGSMSPQNQLDVQGNAHVSGVLSIGNTPTVSGSRGANAALASLLTALQAMGLIIDNTTV